MNELWQSAKETLRGMWHHRWKALAVAWIVGAVAVAVAYRIPERYEASARLWVDTETLLKPLFAGLAIQPNMEQQVSLVSRTLISRPNAEKLVAMTRLADGERSTVAREAVIDDVMRTLKLTSLKENIYQITYRDPDPQRAARVVHSALDIFVESSVGGKKQDTEASIKVVDEQVKRFEETLRATEERLKDFKLKNMASAPSGTDYFARLAEMQNNVEQARLELQTAEKTRDEYRRQLSGESRTPLSEGSDIPELDVRIAQARKDLEGLTIKFTERHPDVLNARRLLAELEAQRKAAVAAAPARPRTSTGTPAGAAMFGFPDRNLALQQLRVSLADSEAAVAAARARLANYEMQYRNLRAMAQRMPQVEAEYAQLNRDYEVQRRTYESLLSRRDSATMGADVQDAGGAKFRVVDPPRVSATPVAPNRFMLLLAAFGAAVVAGIATAFVASQLRPTFHDSRTLREKSGRPTVGMVSLMPTTAITRTRRRDAALFAGGVTGLVVSFATLATFAFLVARAA